MKEVAKLFLMMWLCLDIALFLTSLTITRDTRKHLEELREAQAMTHIETIYVNEVPYEIKIQFEVTE